jgi:hypothetical protein
MAPSVTKQPPPAISVEKALIFFLAINIVYSALTISVKKHQVPVSYA